MISEEEERELLEFDPEMFSDADEDEFDDYDEGRRDQFKDKNYSLGGGTFTDFLLKPEITQAISDAGFEHPSKGKEEFKEDEDILKFKFKMIQFHLRSWEMT